MSSIYWANLPYQIEDAAKKIRISNILLLRVLELIASQIFGLLLFVINFDLSSLLSIPIPIFVQILVNYILFVTLKVLATKFDFPSLPNFRSKFHEQIIRIILLPTSAYIMMIAGTGIMLAIFEQWSIGLTINWRVLWYGFLINLLFLLLIDQLTRIGRNSRVVLLHLVSSTTLLLIILASLILTFRFGL